MSAISTVTEDFTKSSTQVKQEAADAEATKTPGQVTKDAFLKLLVAELTHQDPSQPMDNTQMVNQMSQLQTLEEQVRLREAMENMSTASQLSNASTLTGKYISGKNSAGDEVSGTVAYVEMKDTVATLVLQSGQKVAIGDVTAMTTPADSTSAATAISAQMANANQLLGMYVKGTDDAGLDVEGIALNIKLKNGVVSMGLDNGKTVPLAKISEIYPVVMDDTESTGDNTSTTGTDTTDTTGGTDESDAA